MAPPKKQTTIGFPVFAVTFTPNKPRLLLGGGGGATRAGVKNAMIMYDLDPHTLELKPVAEQLFGKQDDGCMSIAIHPKDKIFVAGVNSPEDQVAAGNNLNCRVFIFKNEKFMAKQSYKTLDSKESIYYQKVARFSTDGKLLVTGTTDGKLSLWLWPDFKLAIPAIDHKGEVADADFDPTGQQLVSITDNNCFVTDTATGKTLWSIENPVMKKTIKSAFRAARFGKRASQGYLFLVINAKDKKRAFICKWQAQGWKLHRQKAIGNKPVTAFTMSENGELLAFGAADLSVSVLSATGLQAIYRVQNAHAFPATALAFSPNAQMLVSASADGTCHIAVVPPASGSWYLFPMGLIGLFIIALLSYLFMLEEDGYEL
ncbi:WD40-repeat-containing domain protein [Powellomyces hirtus]|nr:WD40-repeat-containing domain protein [Powellomyces hirtus]